MKFVIGETLVYPHHGAVTIIKLDKVMVKGEEKTYMTLDVHTSELTIKVPIESAELVGVRDVIDKAGVEAVFEVLRSEFIEEPGNWSRRYKANQEKMASGTVYRGARGRARPRRRGRPIRSPSFPGWLCSDATSCLAPR